MGNCISNLFKKKNSTIVKDNYEEALENIRIVIDNLNKNTFMDKCDGYEEISLNDNQTIDEWSDED